MSKKENMLTNWSQKAKMQAAFIDENVVFCMGIHRMSAPK